MNEIFKPFLRWFVLVFFDDILVYILNEEHHAKHLEVVLKMMNKHELYANQSKCELVN